MGAEQQYLYMGMGKIKGHTVCMSVAYNMDYCIKKAEEFQDVLNIGQVFTKINRILLGDTVVNKSYTNTGIEL